MQLAKDITVLITSTRTHVPALYSAKMCAFIFLNSLKKEKQLCLESLYSCT
jgi:hypothetical protein